MNRRERGLGRRAGPHRRARRLPDHASGGRRGGRSAATRATARRAAASRAASPTLRPGLTGTRRRKRRRGPFGPEVDQSSCAAATPSNLRPDKPLRARGSPARSAPNAAASKHELNAPLSSPSSRHLRALWRMRQLCCQDAAGTLQNTREREVLGHLGDFHASHSHQKVQLVRGRTPASVLCS